MKKLIAITGNDGTGKSTLIAHLLNSHPEMREVSIWDPMSAGLFESKSEIDNYLCQLTPNARVQFLSHALTQAFESAMQSDSEVLLLNGYFYKYFASELAFGADLDLVQALIRSYKTPNLVIKLEAEISMTAKRKKYYSQYECGCQEPISEHFVSFQKRVLPLWDTFDSKDWAIISAELEPAVIWEHAEYLIQTRL